MRAPSRPPSVNEMPRQLLRPIGSVRLAVDVIVALSFFFGASVLTYGGGGVAGVPSVLVGAVMAAALAVRRLTPAGSLAIAWAGALLQMACGLPPLPANIAIFGVLYVTSAYGSRAVMWIGLASAGVGAMTITVYLAVSEWLMYATDLETAVRVGLPTFLAALFGLALAWTAGALVRALRRAGDNRRAEERERARAEAEQERGRIARDMHDVVAHSLAVVVAQADGARYAARADPEAATTALSTISQIARGALSDVRVLLAQLRHSESDGPQPTIADIDPLLAQVRAAGVDLVVDIDPAPPADPPAAVQLAVYRILQEALTNALRHGDGGAVDVRMAWAPDAVEMTVRNGSASRETSGSGHGIIGMRERAQLAGGSLEVESSGGAFTVTARIPWKDPAGA